jgi:hypothetical protein
VPFGGVPDLNVIPRGMFTGAEKPFSQSQPRWADKASGGPPEGHLAKGLRKQPAVSAMANIAGGCWPITEVSRCEIPPYSSKSFILLASPTGFEPVLPP